MTPLESFPVASVGTAFTIRTARESDANAVAEAGLQPLDGDAIERSEASAHTTDPDFNTFIRMFAAGEIKTPLRVHVRRFIAERYTNMHAYARKYDINVWGLRKALQSDYEGARYLQALRARGLGKRGMPRDVEKAALMREHVLRFINEGYHSYSAYEQVYGVKRDALRHQVQHCEEGIRYLESIRAPARASETF